MLLVNFVISFGIKDHQNYVKPNIPPDARDLFLNRLAMRAIEESVDYIENTKLIKERIKEIDHVLVKAFVVYGIPWQTIENPFFIEFLKTLRLAYTPPSKDVL